MRDTSKQMDRREFLKKAGAGAIVGAAALGRATAGAVPDARSIRSFSSEMEYRPLGKTGLWVSAVCLGGHWKRVNTVAPGCFEGDDWLGVNLDHEGFQRNRHDVVSRCIERGINYIDACTAQEVVAYGRALRGRRDQVYVGLSYYQEEMRNERCRTTQALLSALEKGLRESGFEYVDLWRITMNEQSSRHTEAEIEQMMKALATAREQGKARFTGFSSHDRPHIRQLIAQYPDVVHVVVTPYTAKSKELPADSLFDAVRTHKVGVFGIKPFASGSLFAADGQTSPENDERARLAIRHILCNDAITAPIPGLITPQQVDNLVQAVQERRKLDVAEQAKLGEATAQMTASLPTDYQWLREWEWV